MEHPLDRRRFLIRTAAGIGGMSLGGCATSGARQERAAALRQSVVAEGLALPRPRPAQLAWQEAELGVVFHYDLHVFDGQHYDQGRNRRTRVADANSFAPTDLDTDQWMECVLGAGARFAILTASHETGFRLWPSDANPFCTKAIDWRGGRGDVVGDFVASCRKAGVAPGIYLGTRWNAQWGVLDHRVRFGGAERQAAYARMIEQEVEEICTRYGELFELWFDGGAGDPADGAPDVLPIVERHQPECLFYHDARRSDARWGGSETGTVGDPCWATVPWPAHVAHRDEPDWIEVLKHGDPNGAFWSPAMADAPLRTHEWFWEPDDEQKIKSLAQLVGMYRESVGRNATLILGATPGPDGRVPEADTRRMVEFGDAVRRRFGASAVAARTGGIGTELALGFETPQLIEHAVLQEDIRHGERVRGFAIDGLLAREGRWRRLYAGTSIGHQRIVALDPVRVDALRLSITSTVATPIVRDFAACAGPVG